MKRIILVVGLILGILSTSAVAMETLVAGSGANVSLKGKLIIAEDEGNSGDMVKYRAIRLNQPIMVKHELGESEVNIFTLWFGNKKQEATFNRLTGKTVTVVGSVDYYGFGPSAMPNGAKLKVVNIK